MHAHQKQISIIKKYIEDTASLFPLNMDLASVLTDICGQASFIASCICLELEFPLSL